MANGRSSVGDWTVTAKVWGSDSKPRPTEGRSGFCVRARGAGATRWSGGSKSVHAQRSSNLVLLGQGSAATTVFTGVLACPVSETIRVFSGAPFVVPKNGGLTR